MNVYVLTRISEGDSVVVDGVFPTEKKAEKYKDHLLEEFGIDKKQYEYGNTEYNWEIHKEKVQ